ncbi:MAG TPA: hypothetical protein VL362_02470 [Patescibacteria group bacterium]|jgi:hypothetical protein|nr:hypothetical protein [Patescibacteria group bacterium]
MSETPKHARRSDPNGESQRHLTRRSVLAGIIGGVAASVLTRQAMDALSSPSVENPESAGLEYKTSLERAEAMQFALGVIGQLHEPSGWDEGYTNAIPGAVLNMFASEPITDNGLTRTSNIGYIQDDNDVIIQGLQARGDNRTQHQQASVSFSFTLHDAPSVSPDSLPKSFAALIQYLNVASQTPGALSLDMLSVGYLQDGVWREGYVEPTQDAQGSYRVADELGQTTVGAFDTQLARARFIIDGKDLVVAA